MFLFCLWECLAQTSLFTQISNVMKKFFLQIGLFALIVVFADVLIGHGLEYIVSHIQIGGQGRDNYIANKANEDILVFGSSRAVHHYNATMMMDSLGLSCYNCGDDGSGIILSYGRLSMIKDRHQPRIIIQDVTPSFDLIENDNHKYLGWLKAHYNKECVHPIFDDVDKTEKYKMMSYLYRYNSRFLQNLITFFMGIANDEGVRGFRPMKGKIDKMKLREIDELIKDSYVFDSLKLSYIDKFINLVGKAELVFVVSPIWYGMDPRQLEPMKEICRKRGIEFIDFSNDPKYVHNDILFKDGTHLNANGADEFTKDLICYLKNEMQK